MYPLAPRPQNQSPPSSRWWFSADQKKNIIQPLERLAPVNLKFFCWFFNISPIHSSMKSRNLQITSQKSSCFLQLKRTLAAKSQDDFVSKIHLCHLSSLEALITRQQQLAIFCGVTKQRTKKSVQTPQANGKRSLEKLTWGESHVYLRWIPCLPEVNPMFLTSPNHLIHTYFNRLPPNWRSLVSNFTRKSANRSI